MVGQSHHGINSYKVRHKQRNRTKRFPTYRLRWPTGLHQFGDVTHKNSPGRNTTGRTRRVSFRLSRCGAPSTSHKEFVEWGVWTENGRFNAIRQHIRTLNTLLLKHISHAHRRTTTLPPIPPLEPDWIAPTPVTSYTIIHRVGIRRVEFGRYSFGSPEWIHCLGPSTAGRKFVAWCVLTVPMA